MTPKKPSRTKVALDYLARHPAATPYAAAKAVGIAPSVVYRAKAAENRPRCLHCGGLLKDES